MRIRQKRKLNQFQALKLFKKYVRRREQCFGSQDKALFFLHSQSYGIKKLKYDFSSITHRSEDTF